MQRPWSYPCLRQSDGGNTGIIIGERERNRERGREERERKGEKERDTYVYICIQYAYECTQTNKFLHA